MSKQAENSMSAATDKGVLAVMDAAVSSLGAVPGKNAGARKLREARATVAELIEAASDPLVLSVYPYRGAAAKQKRVAMERFRAALTRCGGAQ